MKRIISISLLLLLFLPVAVTVSWLNMEKHLVRKSIKRKIIAGVDKSELTTLTFHKNEIETILKWKHSREFEYKGEMYDIVDTRISGDSIQYWCWWDVEETQLNKKLDNLLARTWNHHPPKNEKHQQLFDWIKGLYISATITELANIPFTAIKVSQNAFYISYFPSIHHTPPGLPPEVSIA